jgi:hypothetical protein
MVLLALACTIRAAWSRGETLSMGLAYDDYCHACARALSLMGASGARLARVSGDACA